MASYRHLLEPIAINGMTVKNRVVMTPMSTHLASADGTVTKELLRHYEARAAGGAGLIIVEDTTVDGQARYSDRGLGLNDDAFIPGWRELVNALHAHGAKVAPQLIHPGFSARSAYNEGRQPVSASPIATRAVKEIPRELSLDEIERIVSRFADAARRAKAAGCDAVQIHAAHCHHLIGSFMSALHNKRTDGYGGSLENRFRLAVEVVESVRAAVGPGFPILMRISGDEYAPGGRSIAETAYAAPMLVDAGVDALLVSGGTLDRAYLTAPPAGTPPAVNAELSAALRRAVRIPVITVGRINDPRVAEHVLAEGKADMVAMGRALIADPLFVRKLSQGKLESIRPCIGCLNCLTEVNQGRRISCSVNPDVGEPENLPSPAPAARKLRVLVVGGGLAGMEAAADAAGRGHEVTLVEKSSRLGGQFIAAAFPPTRQELTRIVQYLEREAREAGVRIELDTEASAETVARLKPDAVVIATGAKPLVPRKIPGIEGKNVVTAIDALLGKVAVGPRVLVIGGGMVGCETADFLAHPLDDMTPGAVGVAVLEMLPNVCMDDATSTRSTLIQRLKGKGVEFITGAEVTAILPDGVSYRKGGEEGAARGFDTIVLALGSRPDDALAESLKGGSVPCYVVGDAKKARRARLAIAEGAEAGRSL